MKCLLSLFALLISLITIGQNSVSSSNKIPLPNKAQLRWQNYEQTMFVALDPATWQGREYDNHSISLKRINPEKLNTDQWCEVAKLWGAKLILFVAKHTGGFCWWQTQTSDYGIKETPWRTGKGDVMKDLAQSCKKFGLGLGIYVYPGDEQWGAGIGSGGTTGDHSKQQAYNKVYRQQLTELLTRYGDIQEVWFDGNCNIPVKDILKKYASDAVILQGKSANIRWVGNEDGIAPYPNWYTESKKDLSTGVSTALHSDPYGDVYAPVEMDVPLLMNKGHKWFWAPGTDSLLMDTNQLMDLYYKSVGRGGVLLLNSTPDTTGLIPASHEETYKNFGEEIKKNFSVPVQKISGSGKIIEMRFAIPRMINHLILQEDLSKGQRVLSYIIEGYSKGKWSKLYEGSSIGNKKIDYFKSIELEKIRVNFVKSKATPQIKNFSAYHILSDVVEGKITEQPVMIGNWQADTYNGEWKEIRFDLTPHVNAIGQYEIDFSTVAYDFSKPAGLEFSDLQLEMYGRNAPESIQLIENGNIIRFTRSQQTLDEFPTILRMKIRSKESKSTGDMLLKRLTF